ncbi:1,2-phenylacetyl-CoA epoxidase subunit PaaE [Nocardioides dongkuii]|uniref:1,2-phenylacetyl-CoA epoxidase subunit PaaE n=1 Tax=Nocardioides dongkuii TaxID=2760089 RepID=UPI0015FE7DEE|nr:1,2-phenylacetyl-CoA epoxidase subunit PaaE [Nocardioides dongkuii]
MFHPLVVDRVERLTDDAVAVTFAVPDDLRDTYAFAAGQSLTLRRVVDGVEHRRSYSICAPVGAAPRIGVREIPDGLFSRWLVREVAPGATVEVLPPTGRWRAEPGGRHLCLAVGSGITPLLSIAGTALTGPDADVTLVYGNRTSASVMFAEEVADLKDRYGARFSVVHVLSREPRDVELFSGRLDADRLRRLLTTVAPVAGVDHVWVCGPFAMVVVAREVLAELGVPPERVHVELFHVDEPPPDLVRAEAVPTGETAEATVVLDGRSTTARVPRDVPLLDGLQATRADLPFACKGGVCGTCRALVRDGSVRMRRNYALEPAEVDAGYVLTCQAVPETERVLVDFDA